ncbi:U1-hexatoxin-Iw1e-like [Uloborus diversus]|uniref:U1-hexatoxin-Iw1e-like n=1 Tax=Uloborus diversus TaxID=327109 RepID=UPI002409F548|nr:U1-hexatoxin-Iw1e-like [Uloborus diversus]
MSCSICSIIIMKCVLVLVAVFAVVLVTSAQEAVRCKNADECGEGECCVVHSILGFRRGECRALSVEGGDCSHPEESIQILGGKYIGFCPCHSGLKCVDEMKEIPIFGEIVVGSKCEVGDEPEPENPDVDEE